MFSELGIYSFKTCARQRQESSGIQGAVTSMIATWNTCYMTDQRLRGFDADQGPGVVHLSSQVEHRGAGGAYTDRPGGNKRARCTTVHMEAPVEPAEACVGAEIQDEALPGDIGFFLFFFLGRSPGSAGCLWGRVGRTRATV